MAADLLVRISGDTSAFAAAMKNVNAEIVSSEQSVARASESFGSFSGVLAKISGIAGGVFSVSAIVSFGESAVQAAAKMDSLERGLTAVMNSSSKAAIELDRLKEVAKLPGLGFEEAVRGSTNLQAAGFSAETSRRALLAFGNALATVGKGKDELDGVILALGQIASKGKISAEEINQLAERVPQIRKVMQQAFGTADTEVLQKMGISAQTFVEQVTSELEKLPRVTGGLQNDLENFSDNWQKMLSEIGKSAQYEFGLVIDLLADLSASIGDAFGHWNKAMALLAEQERKQTATKALKSYLGLGEFTGGSLEQMEAYLNAAREVDDLNEKAGTTYKKNATIVFDFTNHTSRLVEETTRSATAAGKAAKAHEHLGKAMEYPKTLAEELGEAMTRVARADADADMADLAKSLYEAGEKTPEFAARVQTIAEKLSAMGVETKSVATTIRDLVSANDDAIRNMRPVEIKVRLSYDVFEQSIDWEKLGVDEGARRAKEALKQLSLQYKYVIKDQEKWVRLQKEIEQDVTAGTNRLAEGLTDLIFDGGKLKDVFLEAGEAIGKNLLDTVLRQALQPINDMLTEIAKSVVNLASSIVKNLVKGAFKDLGDSITSLTSKLSGLFSTTSSAASAGSSGVTGGSSGVSSIASSGVAGIVGAVGSVVTAVSSVISNFQLARQENTLNAIEENTRYLKGYTLSILEKINAGIPGFQGVQDRIVEVRDLLVGWNVPELAVGGGGGWTVNISNCSWIGYRDMDTFVDELVRRVKAKL